MLCSNLGWKKIFLIMRISILLLIISLQANASLYSQDAKLDLRIQGQPLREVFKQIEQKTQFRFFFGSQHCNIGREIPGRVFGRFGDAKRLRQIEACRLNRFFDFFLKDRFNHLLLVTKELTNEETHA